MCECGCVSDTKIFKFPGPKCSKYILEIYPGCKDCSSGPGIFIRKVKTKADKDLAKEAQDLPFIEFDGNTEAAIRCGPDRYELIRGISNDAYIEELLGDVWDKFIHNGVRVVG